LLLTSTLAYLVHLYVTEKIKRCEYGPSKLSEYSIILYWPEKNSRLTNTLAYFAMTETTKFDNIDPRREK
jgi:hypothetical protein